MKMSIGQNKRLHALLNELGLMEEKKALVLYFTANRSESAKDLEPHQAQALIEHLALSTGGAGYTPPRRPAPIAQPAPLAPAAPRRSRPPGAGAARLNAPKAAPDAEAANRMRRKIFAIGRAMGWLSGDTPEDRAMNRAKLDSFLERKSYLKKRLNSYAPAELPKLVAQFEQIEKHVKSAAAGRAVADLLAELPAVLPAARTRSPRKPAAQ